MPTNKRPFILAACGLLVLLCAAFPPREFSPLREYTPDFPNHPSRKFLFAPEPYLETIGDVGIASAHIDGARFAAEVLAILALTGIALLATTPRA